MQEPAILCLQLRFQLQRALCPELRFQLQRVLYPDPLQRDLYPELRFQVQLGVHPALLLFGLIVGVRSVLIGATRCSVICENTVLLETHGPCESVRKCSADTVTDDTSARLENVTPVTLGVTFASCLN